MAEGREAVDRLRAPDGTLGRSAVRRVLPYGEAFLFVDRVRELTGEAIVAEYLVPESSDWLDAHFEGYPLVPGVILGEGLGQAASLLVRYRLEPGPEREVVGLESHRARFVRPVFPGQLITYRAELERLDRRAARVAGRVERAGKLAATMRLTLGIVPRAVFRASRDRQGREGRDPDGS